MELAHGGKAAGGGARLQAPLLEAGHEAADRGGGGRVGPASRLVQIGQVIVEVAPVGVQGVAGSAALGGQHVEEEARVARPVHEDEGIRLLGIGTVISRGSGSTR